MGKPSYSAGDLAKAVDSAFEANPAVADGTTPQEGKEATAAAQAAANGAAAAQEAAAKRTLALNHRGRNIEVDEDEARNLAQKGFDYEAKMADLKSRRDQLERDAVEYGNYQKYKEYLTNNPKVADSIGRVLETYEARGALPNIDFDSHQEGSERIDPEVMKEIRQLNQKIQQMEVRTATDQLARDMLDTVESNPVLKEWSERSLAAGKKDMALQKLGEAMRSDPNLSLEAAAKVVATEFTQINETLGVPKNAYVGNKKQDQARFGHTERPGDSPPAVQAPEQRTYSGKDLHKGVVRRAVAAFLNQAQM